MTPLLLTLASLEDVTDVATQVGSFLKPGDILFLKGKLGTGKTTFARSLIQSLSPLGAQEEVPSPTFTLIQTYPHLNPPIVHMDLYRLKHPEELLELGFQEELGRSVFLIEWPDLIPRAELSPTLELAFFQDGTHYYLRLTPQTMPAAATLFKHLQPWVVPT